MSEQQTGRALIAGFFEKQSRKAIVMEASAAVLIIGYIDYITGYEISIFVFYALPILLAVWYGGKQCGIFIALFSGIVWWWADTKAGHPYLTNWIQGWDTMITFIFFLFVVVGVSALKGQYELMERSARLEREIIRISEREQQRIGQDLHDGLCQYLAAISCAASSLRNDLQRHSAVEAESAAEIAELLKQGVTQTRNLSRGLFPVQTDEAGLESALDELATSMRRLLNIECEFESVKQVPIYNNEAATHLYRITQEALNNATRHGLATKVKIVITEETGIVTLCIKDNGKGILAGNGKTDGMGLKIMDYRARLIGGDLKVENLGGGGAMVTCRFRQKMNKTVNEITERKA